MAACHAAGYRYFDDWQELTSEQRAILVAHYITAIMVENHKQDAQNLEMEKMRRKGSHKKGKTT